MQKDSFDNLGDLLSGILERLDIASKIEQYRAIELWKEVVGENISKNATATRIKDKVLYVGVSNSSWMQQLHFLKEDIIDALNKKIGSEIVKDIRFYLKRS